MRAELDALRHNDSEIEVRLDLMWRHMRLTESALALEALRHERRRRELKVVAGSLLVGLAVTAVIFYLERAAIVQSADLAAGSLVWTVAVAGLAVSAIGQLAMGISRYRQSLAVRYDPAADRSLPAE